MCWHTSIYLVNETKPYLVYTSDVMGGNDRIYNIYSVNIEVSPLLSPTCSIVVSDVTWRDATRRARYGYVCARVPGRLAARASSLPLGTVCASWVRDYDFSGWFLYSCWEYENLFQLKKTFFVYYYFVLLTKSFCGTKYFSVL